LSHSFSLEDSATVFPVFTSLDSKTTIFFTEKDRQACVQPTNLDDHLTAFMSPVTGWSSNKKKNNNTPRTDKE
jgi:hypothetical protein